MERRWIALAVIVILVAFGSPATAAPPEQWSPPVDGPVVKGYEPPRRRFGPQHLGIDYASPPGTRVAAAGDGVVAFAGLVGRSRSVAIEHGGGRRTTYAYLRRVTVWAGTRVRRGDTLGHSGAAGPGHRPDAVHFGYRVNGRPSDPAVLFRPSPPRISLAPLDRPACPRRRPAAPGYTGRHPATPRREFTRP